MIPTEIKRLGRSGLKVTWADGTINELSSELLRNWCPCAQCRENRGDSSHSAPLSKPKSSLLKIIGHSKEEELTIEAVWGVGNYAIGIRWIDGHDTGIYTYDYLNELAAL